VSLACGKSRATQSAAPVAGNPCQRLRRGMEQPSRYGLTHPFTLGQKHRVNVQSDPLRVGFGRVEGWRGRQAKAPLGEAWRSQRPRITGQQFTTESGF